MSEYNYDYNYEPVATVSKGAKVKGIIAMVLGILSVAGCSSANLLFPIAGIVLASMASKGGETKFSKIGKITSIIGLVCNILCIIGWVMLMASGLFSEIF